MAQKCAREQTREVSETHVAERPLLVRIPRLPIIIIQVGKQVLYLKACESGHFLEMQLIVVDEARGPASNDPEPSKRPL